MKKIYYREEYCIGCRLCEVYCILHHSGSKNLIKVFKEMEDIPEPGIIVEEEGIDSFAIQCRHCEDSPCVKACMTGALIKWKNGIVYHDKDRCVGCWMCVMVCPYGLIRRDEKKKKSVVKCDLCYSEETPACVENCPNEALILKEE